MWLAEPIAEPKYSGLFLRRTFAQLSKSNDSPIMRSADIYKPLGGVYHATDHRWTFPSGAVIEFGHMQHETSILDYQGSQYHRIAYDELTQFSELQYTYMFSRMRKSEDFPWPVGIRAATNPGGPGHTWVRARFIPEQASKDLKNLSYREPSPPGLIYRVTDKRAFIPARLADNPSLDIEDYLERMLTHLPLALRQQLAAGDWDAIEGALIQLDWFKYYKLIGDVIRLPQNIAIDQSRLIRFAVVDTAGTTKDRARDKKGKPPAFSVISVWDHWKPANLLFLRHITRGRWEWPELKNATQQTLRSWSCRKGYCENAHFGPVLMKEVRGVNWQPVGPVIGGMRDSNINAKLDRAVAAGLFKRFEQGQIYLPDASSVPGVMTWLSDYEREVTIWTGDEDETCDQIDVTSYACHVTRRVGSGWGGVIGGRSGKR